jgi:carboxyl-terminal processing protease
MAADSMTSARRTPLIAAIPKMLFPFLVIVPGMIALIVGSKAGEAQRVPTAENVTVGSLQEAMSYGKGIIQSVEQLSDGAAVKLTIMQYFSPKGNVIHKVGIKPDVEVEALATDTTDKQLEKAVELIQ